MSSIPGPELYQPSSFSGRASSSNTNRRRRKPDTAPELGVGDVLGACDSSLVADLLPDDLSEVAFNGLRAEVQWQTMYHRGGEVPRLVAVQGEVADDGSFPVYRHPADESPPLAPFSPTAQLIREHVQKASLTSFTGTDGLHLMLTAGSDHISEHSDKTIDVVRGSSIVNVSLGAQRVMTLRMKRDGIQTPQGPTSDDSSSAGGAPRVAQRIPLPHNSMFVLGPLTNAQWLHGINHDNRPLWTKSEKEQLEGGARISLTFRHIGTFLSRDEKLIWGQGASGKVKENAREVVHGGDVAKRMISAFGEENQQSNFNWDEVYGDGFDVLHFKIPATD